MNQKGKETIVVLDFNKHIYFQDIDRLIEETRQRGYTALLDLTNRGFRYASNVVLNTAVLVNRFDRSLLTREGRISFLFV